MIKEQFVGYKTALLLKEKGFDEEVFMYYHIHDKNDFSYMDTDEFENYCENDYEQVNDEYSFFNHCSNYRAARCTQQMAMRWLREKHDIAIVVTPDFSAVTTPDKKVYLWNYEAYKIVANENMEFLCRDSAFCSYEQACEAGIERTLNYVEVKKTNFDKMNKFVFDIKYRERIEKKELKVITSFGEPAEIVKWDCHGRYPILAVIYDGDTDDCAFYREDGSGYHRESYLIIVENCDDEHDYDKVKAKK
jgi:hypothetical protein